MWYSKKLTHCSLLSIFLLGISTQAAFADNDITVYEGEYLIHQASTLRSADARRSLSLVRKGLSLRSTGRSRAAFNKQTIENDCAELELELGKLDLCEPNIEWKISATPDDPQYGSLYGLEKLDLPSAWEIQKGSKSITVAVLDTGVDYTHQDLKDNMWSNPDEIPNNGLDDDHNGWVDDVYGIDTYNEDGNPYDDHGHGTHCAGIIGARGDNGTGVVGVNWNTQIMALKFLASNGGGSTYDAIAAIDYAIAHGVDVINASFGGRFSSQALYDAVSRANDAGILFVAAAGNDNNDNDAEARYPANFDLPNVISVAATDSKDKRAFFSNYGSGTVHVAAPGVSILSTLPSNRYGSLSGTSMAAPHITGSAALILAEHPDYSPVQVKNLLINTSDVISGLSGVVTAAGRVNIRKALGAEGVPSESGGSGGSSGPEQGTIEEDLKVTLRGVTGINLKGGRFRSKVIGGTSNEEASVALTLTNKSGSVTCELGSIELGSTYKLRGAIPRRLGVQRASLSVKDTSSPERKVTTKKRIRRSKSLRSLESACSIVNARVRSINK